MGLYIQKEQSVKNFEFRIMSVSYIGRSVRFLLECLNLIRWFRGEKLKTLFVALQNHHVSVVLDVLVGR